MERTTLDALEWKIGKGDQVVPISATAPHRTNIQIRRRFQFSSALKRMSTIATLPNGKVLVSVKGAPETIKDMLDVVPEGYDDTYKYFTRRGSRVLALAWKDCGNIGMDKVRLVWLRSKCYAHPDALLDKPYATSSSGKSPHVRRLPGFPLPFESRCCGDAQDAC